MKRTAKLFRKGRSQAVRLPADYGVEDKEVFIRRDPVTGDVTLSLRPDSWEGFLALPRKTIVPEDFMTDRSDQPPQRRELF